MNFSIILSFLLYSLLTFGQNLTKMNSSLEKLKLHENGLYQSEIYSIAQNDNTELNRIITKIESQEYLFDDYELKKKSVRLANKLNKIATENGLLELSKKDCKLCFSFSFWVLSKRKSELTEQLYTDFFKNNNEEQVILINEFTKRNKGCIRILMSQQNFIFDIYNDGKYLDAIK